MIVCITKISIIGSTLTPPTLDQSSSRFTGTLAFNFYPQNTTLHGPIQWPVIPGTMLVTPCCHSRNNLVCRMSLLSTITKMFQDQAPSDLKYAVIRTYDTCLRIPTFLDRIPLKGHVERYYCYTRKSVSRRVCRNDCFPISLIGAETPAMQLQ